MSDPKNKWNQPAAPPPPMFFGKKERDLVKQVNDELAERVIGQTIAYYPISLEESNFNDTYGEAIEKVSLPPVRVYAYVEVENEQTNEKYGYEYQTKLTVNFHRKRLTEDQNLYVRVGDFVQYGDLFYEIVKLYNDTRYLFGQVEHKFQVSAECVRAREGAFRVIPAVDRPAEVERDQTEATSPAPRSAPYPPLTATYITVTPDTKLPNERVLTAGSGITITDGGANSSITIASSGQNAIGPTGSLQLAAGSGSFSGSSSLLFLTASNLLQIVGDISASINISASSFYGDGSNLTGITASAVSVADGPVGSLQFRVDTPVSGEISGSTNILYDISNNRLSFGGGLVYNRTALTSNYTASTDDHILAVTSVPIEILLDATTFSDGQAVVIKDETGLVSTTDTIALNASASQTIDGLSTISIESPHGSVLLYSNGANWFIY